MARALIEGWLSERPEEQRELRASLVEIGLNRGERAADRVAAIKAVMLADFNAAKMEADAATASQAKVIVVRRIDPQPALTSPEPDENGPGEGSI